MFKKKFIYAFIAIGTIIAYSLLKSCGKENIQRETVREYISKPFPKVTIPRTFYEVDAAAGAVLLYATTRITIPQCAFLDSSGNVVDGKVKLGYREVNDPASILVSGIPMAVADTSEDYLESAGMLEMVAWKDGVPLQVNDACRILVNKQSSIGDGDYNLYNLDTVNRKWVLKEENIKAEPVVIVQDEPVYVEPDYEALANKQGIIKYVKPVKKAKEKFQFKFKMDFSKNPELNIYNGVQWEFAGTRSKENPAKNPWVLTARWSEMEIISKHKNGKYKLRLVSGSKEFTTTVKPVFAGEDMEYAKYVYGQKYQAYRDFVAKKKEEARLWKIKQEKLAAARAQQAKLNASNNLFYREIGVRGFGWCNLDRLQKEDMQKIAVSFTMTNGDSDAIDRVYVLAEGVNSAMTFYKNAFDSFIFPRGRSNHLVVIDTLARAYIIGPSAFTSISSTDTKHEFRVSGTGAEIESMEDVKKLLKGVKGSIASM